MKILTFIAITLVAAGMARGKERSAAKVQLPAKDSVHLFLLAGQSNMAGRGKVEEEDRKPHPRVFAFSKDGTWKHAVDPVHYDKRSAGVGLGRSFAIVLAERHKNISIGLIPAACGGSPISTWEPGGYHGQTKSHPYDDAIKRARLAMKDGMLKGILWHQGESDCNPKCAALYERKLRDLVARFRKELEAPNLPFIIGQLGQFANRPWNDNTGTVNEAHLSISKDTPAVGFVPSDGLTAKRDNVHFNAESLREFGKRYAEAYAIVAARNAGTRK